jgi:hypothetical protein
VRSTPVGEIYTRFFNDRDGDGHSNDEEEWIEGLNVTDLVRSNRWIQQEVVVLGAYLSVNHEAHVEASEDGTPKFLIGNQLAAPPL